MIIRVFRGRVRPGMESAYEAHLKTVGIPDFARRAGFLGISVGTPSPQAPDEFLVVTAWRDLEAVQAFAGRDWTRAHMLPDEGSLLVGSSVHHYEDATAPAALPMPEFRLAPPPDAIRNGTLAAGRVTLDLAARRAWVEGDVIDVPPKEFEMLTALALEAGRPVPVSELAARVWPDSAYATAEDVRRTVYRLRRYLGDNGRRPPLIRNRRGLGYLLDP